MSQHQVNLILQAIDSNIKPAQRLIKLTPNNYTIKIGRASKSLAKGLLGATDNAWFDSPVMSREHAEIIFNSPDLTVSIHDTGSMHGTYVNGEKLQKEPRILSNGDRIVFGTEIRRGAESFPACPFGVQYEMVPWVKSKAYSVPDSSDEEDDDYNFSDVEVNERPSSGDDLDIEIMQPKPSQTYKVSRTIEAIDLTRDDTPPSRVNSTSAPALVAATNGPESSSKTISSLETLHKKMSDARKLPTPVDLIELLSDSESDSDSIFNAPDRPEEEISASESEGDDASSDASSDSAFIDEDESEPAKASCVEKEIASSSASPSPAPSSPRQEAPAMWCGRPAYENMEIPESHVRTRLNVAMSEEEIDVGSDGDDGEDDDGSELGLSEAGQEGLKVLFDDGLLEHPPVNPLAELMVDRQSQAFAPVSAPSWSHDTKMNTGFQNTRNTRPDPFSRIRPSFGGPMHLRGIIRQPSPSDAAMFKGAAVPTSRTETTSMDRSSERSWNVPSIKSLGDKTGKHAFFAAREDNKQKLSTQLSDVEDDGGMPPPSVPEAPVRQLRSVRFAPTIFPERADIESTNMFRSKAMQEHAKSSDYHTEMELTSEPSTRVHPFYFSSDASSCAPESPVNEKHPVRSGLRIDDIIDNSSSSTKTHKRKAEEISEVLEKEVRSWASAVNKANSAARNTTSPPEVSPPVVEEAISTAVAPRDIDVRPSKRMKIRKFAEAVGYAALGAAAASAGLFSVLVATAPEFV